MGDECRVEDKRGEGIEEDERRERREEMWR